MGRHHLGLAAGVGGLVALVAAVGSLGRLILASPGSIGELVWAEDGLFPLCVRKAGMWDCLRDPFAGYLLGVPRLLAGIPAVADLHSWGWVTNVVAGICWGVLSGLLAYWLVARGFATLPSVVLSVLPVVIPLVGLESVNSVASIYMPLLYTSTVIASVGWRRRTGSWVAAGLFFLTAITIPLAVVLAAVLLVSLLKGRISRSAAVSSGSALVIGLLLQFFVVITAENTRNVTFSTESLGYWFSELPVALLTLWPGLYFGEVTIFGIFALPVAYWSGAALVVILGALGLRWSLCNADAKSVAGALILSGLVYSFVPTATGYASNRYFVPTVLGVMAAAVFVLADASSVRRQWILPCVVAVLAVAWLPAFPASDWRSNPAPKWSDQVQQVVQQCAEDPMSPARFEFSPNWPQEGVTQLFPPTNQFVPCKSL